MNRKPKKDNYSAFADFADSWQDLEADFQKTPKLSSADNRRVFARGEQQADEGFTAEAKQTRTRFVSECEVRQGSFQEFRESLAPFAQRLEDEQVALEGEELRVRARMGALPSGAIAGAVSSDRAAQTLARTRRSLEQAESDFRQQQAANRTTMAVKKRQTLPEV